MDLIISLIFSLAILAFLLLLRNYIVYKIQLKAISVIFAYSDWKENTELLEKESYVNKVLDLTRWTFRQFYPELITREKNLDPMK